jgi:hypothetical protein
VYEIKMKYRFLKMVALNKKMKGPKRHSAAIEIILYSQDTEITDYQLNQLVFGSVKKSEPSWERIPEFDSLPNKIQ